MKRQGATDMAPIWAGFCLLLFCGLLLLTNLALLALNDGKGMKLAPAVYGVTAPPPDVALRPSNVLNGNWQHLFAQRISFDMPLFPLGVRLRNQVEYSLFGVSATKLVVVGKDGVLFEREYVQNYCSRDLTEFLRTAPAWAAAVANMQNIVAARGQAFFYVLTPSKPAGLPQFLPATPPCAATLANRTGLVPAWLALLRAQHVNVADFSAGMANKPFAIFPRGGAHWNQAAAAGAAAALEADIAIALPKADVRPVPFSVRITDHPQGIDMDDAGVMNLLFPLDHYDVPVVTYQTPAAVPGCRKLRIVIVGGSFMWGVGAALSHLPCAPVVVEYWYWSTAFDSWIDGAMSVATVDPKRRDADLRAADVVLYEENEEVLGHSRHGKLFYEWLTMSPNP